MNELNPSNWIYWLGLVSLSCMLLPVIVVLMKRHFNPGLIALTIYFLSTFTYNLLLIVFPVWPKEIRTNLGIANNLLDTPLMLLFLIQFTYNRGIRKLLKICLFAYLTFELGVVLLYGFSVRSISIFSGPGLLIVLGFSFYFFTLHIRVAITHKREIAKTLMISGILFGYAVYFMVYLFYYVLQTPNKMDALIIYFLASIAASALLAAGLKREKLPTTKTATADNPKFTMQRQTTLPKISG
jgi:hypothetical protein